MGVGCCVKGLPKATDEQAGHKIFFHASIPFKRVIIRVASQSVKQEFVFIEGQLFIILHKIQGKGLAFFVLKNNGRVF